MNGDVHDSKIWNCSAQKFGIPPNKYEALMVFAVSMGDIVGCEHIINDAHIALAEQLIAREPNAVFIASSHGILPILPLFVANAFNCWVNNER
jgi:hypothetical protein